MTIPVKYRSQSSNSYTLDQFRDAYQLSAFEAARLFSKYGPSAPELDALMMAKRLHGKLDSHTDPETG
ncbi:hypothetical protein FVA81_02130 (plasmid) [Rhizobium sp. WL3]|uniref:hypothetical protein n=1 Tax=Rhizobium sp. WL3 TaxID=2603277 RepID=UPI0011C1FA5B|nr:hypothetical protein [Rhizobium sp. WL3]QEE43463.1 hypothetical protein FVA81_02130 [Rhizobium sp. WL3]